jgi:hypothetical protein
MQLKKVVDPFGEVNVYPNSGGKVRVTATILMEPHREGTQTGIALDGSGSMANLYGARPAGALSPIFSSKKSELENIISPVAQKMCAYLARKIDADGGTTCIYWATGPGGGQIEEIGDLTADRAEAHTYGPPKNFGTGTRLLPALKYFTERFKDAPFGFYVFITDGEIHDLIEVKSYTKQLAKDISAKRRNPLKCVLIGIGADVNERQMEELDDLDTGTDIDVWDHKLASELRVLEQIFAEVVDRNARVAPKGKIVDPSGNTLKDFSDAGVPTMLEFEAPASTAYFTLDIPGFKVHQGLSDTANVPASEPVERAPTSTTSTPTSPIVGKQEPSKSLEDAISESGPKPDLDLPLNDKGEIELSFDKDDPFLKG